MKNFFLGKIIGYAAKKLDGYKTIIGGVGLILTGVTGIAGIMFPDQQLPQMEIKEAFGFIGLGCAALGIGGKSEKQTAAIREQNELVKEQNKILEKSNVAS